MVAFTLVGVPGGVAMLLSGLPVAIAFGVSFIAFLVLAWPAHWSAFMRRRDGRVEVAGLSGELRFPAARGLRPITVAGPWVVVLAAAALVVAGATGEDLNIRGGPFAGFALGVAAILAVIARSSTGPVLPTLTLTPQGIRYRNRKRGTNIRWEELGAVAVEAGPLMLVERVARRGPTEVVTVPLSLLASDPLLVIALIEHYRRYPEHRAELADGTAVGRIERGDFTAHPVPLVPPPTAPDHAALPSPEQAPPPPGPCPPPHPHPPGRTRPDS